MYKQWIFAQLNADRFSRFVSAFSLIAWIGISGAAAQASVTIPVESKSVVGPLEVRELVLEALTNNPSLQAKQFELQAAQESLLAARASYRPSVNFNARYTRADGGRTIDFPIGDALNPAYANLNRLNALNNLPGQFPSIDNQSFNLLREREQDTRISVQGLLYSPELNAAIVAATSVVAQREASREVFARTLARDVQLVYYQLGQAIAGRKTLQASKVVLQENVRVNRALVAAGSTTKDRALRAEAEVLAIEDRLQSAKDQERNAQRLLGFLLGRSGKSPSINPSFGPVSAKSATHPTSAKLRPELQEIRSGIAALQANTQAQKARLKPTLSYGVDGGIQGSEYQLGNGKNFATASIVMNWRLFDFGSNRAKVASLQRQSEALQANLDNLSRALSVAARQARAEFRSAALRNETAAARLLAAEESYRISAKKRDAGALSQIEFLDAERALTEARLALDAARFDQARRFVEWEFATASFLLPKSFLLP